MTSPKIDLSPHVFLRWSEILKDWEQLEVPYPTHGLFFGGEVFVSNLEIDGWFLWIFGGVILGETLPKMILDL